MKIIKDEAGEEMAEWEGIDWFWANTGFGIGCAVILMGIAGCLHILFNIN